LGKPGVGEGARQSYFFINAGFLDDPDGKIKTIRARNIFPVLPTNEIIEHKRNLAKLAETRGDIAAVQNDLDKAESLYKEALDASEQVLGNDHPDTIAIERKLDDLRKRRK
jgi:hypothetical protein